MKKTETDAKTEHNAKVMANRKKLSQKLLEHIDEIIELTAGVDIQIEWLASLSYAAVLDYDAAHAKVKAIRNSWDCRPTKALIEWAQKTLKPMTWVCEELETQGFSMRDYWEVKSCIAELADLYKIKK